MFKLFTPNDERPWRSENFAIAVSGGYDSMAVASFFVKGKYKPTIIHVNHSTGNDAAQAVVEEFAKLHGLNVIVHTINPVEKPKRESWEEFWRNKRLEFFKSQNMPVITGHNLNDAMETWIFSAINGNPKLIPYRNGNIYRPFLLTKKEELKDYAVRNNIKWHEDKSNGDVRFSRNRIRHNIIPEILAINEGFDTTIRNLYNRINTENQSGTTAEIKNDCYRYC